MNDNGDTMNERMEDNGSGHAVPPVPAPPATLTGAQTAQGGGKGTEAGSQASPEGAGVLEARASRSRMVWRVVLGVITVVVLVALIAAVVLVPLPKWLVDPAKGGASATAKPVSQTDLTYYCPSRMALSDSGKYGDSAFQPSEGNVASSARYGAFGSVYQATVSAVTNGSEADDKKLTGDDTVSGASVKTYSGSADKGSSAFETRLLAAKSGTGAAAAVASWASEGDLKGLSASTCVAPALEQDFLLGPTTTGSTQQLSVANFSSKATSLQIRVWSTKHGTPLQLSTGNILNVGANGEATQELSAAAPGNDALFVTVTSKETPIAAVVRSVELNGLSAMGSDYATPLRPSSRRQYLPGFSAGDGVKVLAHARRSTDLSLSWVDGKGATQAKTQHLDAGKVAVVDMGQAPQDVVGLQASAAEPVDVVAKVTRNIDSDTDFAYVSPASVFAQSALVLPDHTDGTLALVNTSGSPVKATLRGYDASGKPAGDKDIDILANAGVNVAAKDIGQGAVMFTLKGGRNIAMGARLVESGEDQSQSASLAHLNSSGLEPQNMKVWVRPNAGIVR
ncbi:DUF5719 family protein [Bifidobacterium sp. ESL0775]|uniref:DUF5719 family protein n=1 Tax=Bifidobacterium sp. ESL0775 TaxID=2983230 RepID=UPI0023F72363|nr:DUF5719 family protein [Bifidobacterium sp. ESL0775]WEV68778.1 DUF5719 family protein [Bifidobacterium sp. ESL0775]